MSNNITATEHTNLVQVINNQPMVSSRQVAENFEREHKHVLAAIDQKKSTISSAEFSALFEETTYTAANGKQNREYLLTRDGFSFIVMGFTGAKADAWKIKYIQAFNKMERKLAANTPQLPDFTNPAIAARAWAEQYEARQKAETKVVQQNTVIAELEPKSEALDVFMDSAGYYDLDEAAKYLLDKEGKPMGGRRLRQYLAEEKWIYRRNGRWQAMQKRIEEGHLHMSHYQTKGMETDSGRWIPFEPKIQLTRRGLGLIQQKLARTRLNTQLRVSANQPEIN